MDIFPPDRLRQWREHLAWTQAQAADALRLEPKTYKQLERGVRRVDPHIWRLCELAKREHLRALIDTSTSPSKRQSFATPPQVTARVQALDRAGKLTEIDGRPRLRYVSLCSGIEAATAAFERIGSNAVAVAYAETDPTANAVLRYRWPNVPRVGDLTNFDWSALHGQVDLVVAGPPCQSFSVAGRQLGLDDPRGNLIIHVLRAMGAMQPKWCLIENVPGLIDVNGGNDFKTVVESLRELGYTCAWRTMDAKHFGVPQRRRRLWLVGERHGVGRAPGDILGLPGGATRGSKACGTMWKAAPRQIARSARTLNWEGSVDDPCLSNWTIHPDRRLAKSGLTRSIINSLVRELHRNEQRINSADHAFTPPNAPDDSGECVPTEVYAVSLRNWTISDISPTLLTKGNSLNSNPCVIVKRFERWAIRRMTPLECLRLQGFDEDWFDGLTFCGKPLSKTEQYRLIGNAWPVPVAAWLLERLEFHHHQLDQHRRANDPMDMPRMRRSVAEQRTGRRRG